MNISRMLIATLTLFSVSAAWPSGEPTNLSTAKAAIARYHDSGRWAKDIVAIETGATRFIVARAPHVKRPAIVLDIDDTSLSTWSEEKAMDFGYVPTLWNQWEQGASAPAIPATLKLFRAARKRGITVFFITGRRETSRTWTEKNLESAGFHGYLRLYLRPVKDTNPSVAPFKSSCRKAITKLGYRIIANFGDQLSDLRGGYSERAFKLPNPMYLIP